MASVVCTLRIMPESPETDLHAIEKKAKELLTEFTGKDEFKVDIQPVAFGLKSMDITFITPEEKGSPDEAAEKISAIEGVNSAEITDVRRAVG